MLAASAAQSGSKTSSRSHFKDFFFFAGATGKAKKWRHSASTMYRGVWAWGTHIKTAAGYGAAATAGGALGPNVAGSGLGIFGFGSSGVLAKSLAAHWMSAAGVIKAGSWYSFWQSAGAGGACAPFVLVPSTFAMSFAGVYAYSKRKEMYQGARSVFKKIQGYSRF